MKVEGNTVVAANGERHEVDVIIWGTGFEVSHPPIGKRVHNEKVNVYKIFGKIVHQRLI